jgi:hypothetical protein
MDRQGKILQLRGLIFAWPESRTEADAMEQAFDQLSFLTDIYGDLYACVFKGVTIYKMDFLSTPAPCAFPPAPPPPSFAPVAPSATSQWLNCPSSVVTEKDFRIPEFRDANPADYEFDKNGKVVRKDRFAKGFEKLFQLLKIEDVDTVIAHVDDLLTTEEHLTTIAQLLNVDITKENSIVVISKVKALADFAKPGVSAFQSSIRPPLNYNREN